MAQPTTNRRDTQRMLTNTFPLLQTALHKSYVRRKHESTTPRAQRHSTTAATTISSTAAHRRRHRSAHRETDSCGGLPVVARTIDLVIQRKPGQLRIELRVAARHFVHHQVERRNDHKSPTRPPPDLKYASRGAPNTWPSALTLEHQTHRRMRIVGRRLAAHRDICGRHQLPVAPLALVQHQIGKPQPASVARSAMLPRRACAASVFRSRCSA